MTLSVRLDESLAQKINKVAKQRSMKKSDIIRYCLETFLKDIDQLPQENPYQLYLQIKKEIPASGDGSLSVKHRQKVLELIKKKQLSRL